MNNSRADELLFKGRVIKGSGCFSKELILPGNSEIRGVIRNWPEKLESGTLNVLIDETGYPEEFERKFGRRTEGLDERRFLPEVELRHSQIGNNTITPGPGEREDKGNAQIWRAHLKKIESGETVQCWVLRRIGSRMPHRLECVAGFRIRDKLSLAVPDNDAVELTIEGTWL